MRGGWGGKYRLDSHNSPPLGASPSSHRGILDFLGFWDSGLLGFWASGFLDVWDSWTSGLLVILGFLSSGHLDFWTSGILDFWAPELLGVWAPGFLATWSSGLRKFWDGLASVWRVDLPLDLWIFRNLASVIYNINSF